MFRFGCWGRIGNFGRELGLELGKRGRPIGLIQPVGFGKGGRKTCCDPANGASSSNYDHDDALPIGEIGGTPLAHVTDKHGFFEIPIDDISIPDNARALATRGKVWMKPRWPGSWPSLERASAAVTADASCV